MEDDPIPKRNYLLNILKTFDRDRFNTLKKLVFDKMLTRKIDIPENTLLTEEVSAKYQDYPFKSFAPKNSKFMRDSTMPNCPKKKKHKKNNNINNNATNIFNSNTKDTQL